MIIFFVGTTLLVILPVPSGHSFSMPDNENEPGTGQILLHGRHAFWLKVREILVKSPYKTLIEILQNLRKF